MVADSIVQAIIFSTKKYNIPLGGTGLFFGSARLWKPASSKKDQGG
jgi:hypothetical protein